MPEMTPEDWARFRAAVRLRDRCVAEAVDQMEFRQQRVDQQAARTTYDAIAEIIREDERERLRASGRLVPEGAETRTEYAVRWPENRPSSFPPVSGYMDRETAERFAASYQGVKGEVASRWCAVGPWLPVEPAAPNLLPASPTSGSKGEATATG